MKIKTLVEGQEDDRFSALTPIARRNRTVPSTANSMRGLSAEKRSLGDVSNEESDCKNLHRAPRSGSDSKHFVKTETLREANTSLPILSISESLMVPNSEIQELITLVEKDDSLRRVLIHQLSTFLGPFLDGNVLAFRRTRHEIAGGVNKIKNRLGRHRRNLMRLKIRLANEQYYPNCEYWVPRAISIVAGVPVHSILWGTLPRYDPEAYSWKPFLREHNKPLATMTIGLMHDLDIIRQSSDSPELLEFGFKRASETLDQIIEVLAPESENYSEDFLERWIKKWESGSSRVLDTERPRNSKA
ncbi:hypothetical protein PT974_05987 [Cladobotryum mycophilum]|uniref:Uncharacterized protein n=1 Tax=Cladobotryum mycophilum TaxID=491253 RepID=A0ABR0SKA6_9HYPO